MGFILLRDVEVLVGVTLPNVVELEDECKKIAMQASWKLSVRPHNID